ncbi:hypothetical protein MNBD_GAMMA10-1114 [hydrothermal vent metagenome]|uniref:YtkA-like domain-containing protein n=1 Tax=hydrothermal vent metagenome TaxID=652676 RepID=A0A3B0XPC3_9ZZZZ
MKKIVFIALLMLLVLSASWFAGQWLQKENAPSKIVATYSSSCDLLQSACEFKQFDNHYTIKLIGKPSPLSPFVVQLDAAPSSMDAAEISFKMRNMDMGYAVYSLRRYQLSDTWQASVILPVCLAGRADWVLSVKLQLANQQSVVKFDVFVE